MTQIASLRVLGLVNNEHYKVQRIRNHDFHDSRSNGTHHSVVNSDVYRRFSLTSIDIDTSG